jgi:hypothetical protein
MRTVQESGFDRTDSPYCTLDQEVSDDRDISADR